MNLPDGTKWLYGYDRLSQVTSGERVDAATNEPVSGGSFRYAYDGIGNRVSAQEGSSANLLRYSANSLNQYVSIFSPGVIPIRGRADADAKVAVTTTIGGASTTYVPNRDGQGFSIDIPVDNSQGAVTAAVQVDALKHDGTLDMDLHRRLSGDYTVPATTPQVPTYDADGNMLTCDGWTYAWNAQDRLVSATKGDIRLEFNYDYLGRRFEKKVYENNVLTKHSLFIYDGFKQIAEYDALASNALENTYLWQPVGLDVPLLRNGQEFFVSDANKNIVALLDTTGNITDTYIYDPFGNCTHTGSSTNPFRFSSEFYDGETGLVYYNYRYYSPDLGRWLSRDPSEERYGGLTLYGMCQNNFANVFDNLGLWLSGTHWELTDTIRNRFWIFEALLGEKFSVDAARQLAFEIIDIITEANIDTDSPWGKGWQQEYHYCTEYSNRSSNYMVKYINALKQEQTYWKETIIDIDSPNEVDCKQALEILGTLTHMWQDYYGHGVEYDPNVLHPDGSPKRDFSIGKITGNPDNPTMDPVTFDTKGFRGNHGDFSHPFTIEPGDRAEDREERLRQAREFTHQKINEMMPVWITKCSCVIGHWAK